jgi:hypothetical protein
VETLEEPIKKVPSQTEQQRAERRIHQALDKGLQPSPGDVNILELAGIPLENLLSSRQETQAKIAQVVGKPEKITLDPSGSKEGLGQERKPPRDKRGKDLYEFFNSRIGPLMILILFVFMRDWDKARLYALSPDECHELAGPASNVFARFEKLFDVPDWIHEVIVSSDDTVTILYVLVGYLERTGLLDKIIHFCLPVERKQDNGSIGYPEGIQTEESTNGVFTGNYQGVAGLQHLSDI